MKDLRPVANKSERAAADRVRRLVGLLFGIALLASFAPTASAESVPRIDSPVVDRAGVISSYQEEYLGEQLREHYERTGVQMAVLLVETTHGMPIETYSLQVAQNWEGGRDGADRGVLLTLAVRDRRSRLEVGYGLEFILTDSVSARILKQLREPLRARNYYGAVDDAVDEVIDRTDHLEPGGMALPSLDSWWESPTRGFWTAIILGWVLMALLQLLRRREVMFVRGDRGRWVIAGMLAVGAVATGLLTTGVMWTNYVLVYIWGSSLALGVASEESYVWAVPPVAYAVLGLAMLAIPGLAGHVIAPADMFSTMFIHIFFVMLSYSLFLGVTVSGSGGGRSSSYSSSGYSSSSAGSSGGGGYSGGGGSFGGGGASGSW